MDSMIVVHPLDNAMCGGVTDVDPSRWLECQQPEGGTLVTCGNCTKVGVLPHPDHMAAYLQSFRT